MEDEDRRGVSSRVRAPRLKQITRLRDSETKKQHKGKGRITRGNSGGAMGAVGREKRVGFVARIFTKREGDRREEKMSTQGLARLYLGNRREMLRGEKT